jgi:uncharacterized protein DUF551
MNDWIKCSDTLPQNGRNVLVFLKDAQKNNCYSITCQWNGKWERRGLMYYPGGGQSEMDIAPVLYWMPLPKEPVDE